MSRTDKDVPYRVRVLHAEENSFADHAHHLLGVPRFVHRNGEGYGYVTYDECDIDNPPRPGDSRRLCEYEFPRWMYSPYERPNPVERRNQWHKPDRCATRRGLLDLARSFTDSEDLDDLNDDHVRVEQHRGRAGLGCGYWD